MPAGRTPRATERASATTTTPAKGPGQPLAWLGLPARMARSGRASPSPSLSGRGWGRQSPWPGMVRCGLCPLAPGQARVGLGAAGATTPSCMQSTCTRRGHQSHDDSPVAGSTTKKLPLSSSSTGTSQELLPLRVRPNGQYARACACAARPGVCMYSASAWRVCEGARLGGVFIIVVLPGVLVQYLHAQPIAAPLWCALMHVRARWAESMHPSA
jgi:hypothetical protein